MSDHSTRPSDIPSFQHRQTGLRALDEPCLGLPVGALTQMTGRQAADVDLFIDALRRADPHTVVIDTEYAAATKSYRAIIEELRALHAQSKPVIIRCAPPSNGSYDFNGEESVIRALGVVAKVYPSSIVLAWCGRPGEGIDDVDELELWIASTNVGTLVDARRDDEEDNFPGVALEDMVGDLLFDVTFFDPRSAKLEYHSLTARDLG